MVINNSPGMTPDLLAEGSARNTHGFGASENESDKSDVPDTSIRTVWNTVQDGQSVGRETIEEKMHLLQPVASKPHRICTRHSASPMFRVVGHRCRKVRSFALVLTWILGGSHRSRIPEPRLILMPG